MPRMLLAVSVAFTLVAPPLSAQILGHQKISLTRGGFGGDLDAAGQFGAAMTRLDDLDDDGIDELVIGANYANDSNGEVWVVFLNQDGTVKREQQITAGTGGFTGPLGWDHRFGYAVARIGDVNGDGACDLAVNSFGDDHGGLDNGAIWILFMDPDPTKAGLVIAEKKLAENLNGAPPSFDHDSENFGYGLAGIGDLDGDGVPDLVAGADPGFSGSSLGGRLWILFLNADGTVKSYREIREGVGGFTGDLETNDRFGIGIGNLGDLDGDQVIDLAVGAWGDDDGGPERGALYVLFMNLDGTVKAHQKISSVEGGLTADLQDNGSFGSAPTWLSTRGELLVGAHGSDGVQGTTWLLSLDAAGMVLANIELGEGHCGFTGDLDADDSFGRGACSIGDLDGNGQEEIVIGAFGDDDGVADAGAAWVLFERECGSASWTNYGAGVPGTIGEPSLALSGPPVIGSTVTLSLVSSTNVLAPAVLFLGLGRAAIPFRCGQLLALPNWILLLLLNPAGASIPGPLPGDYALCGLTLDAQLLVFDAGACGDMAMSQGLEMVLGS